MSVAIFGSLFILLSSLGTAWLFWRLTRSKLASTASSGTVTVTTVNGEGGRT